MVKPKGMCKCLEEEFSSIYVFNLRGIKEPAAGRDKKEAKFSGQQSNARFNLLLVKTRTPKKKSDNTLPRHWRPLEPRRKAVHRQIRKQHVVGGDELKVIKPNKEGD